MTMPLFRSLTYLREAPARVRSLTDEGGIVLDRTIFYPTGGGQPGDSGALVWSEGRMAIATAVKGPEDSIILIPAEPAAIPQIGQAVRQEIDWERRHRHMRVHTALHLLSVVIPLPVTGGAIGADKGRLDFDMSEAPQDLGALEAELNGLIAGNHQVSEEWISEADLDANPGLVKTLSVQPPRGTGRVRLIRIGSGDTTIDLQPCGGTHVNRTGEIGPVRIGKIEKKGRINRRVTLMLT
ncbi:MAG: alanyl-tRNA editing protein [Rhodobacterales bacterium]|nr:alanyl-tRNA editing protein [Rhodobacterales bacterium]